MTCIYCGLSDPTRFRGVEHVIPQAFGRFSAEALPTVLVDVAARRESMWQ